MKKINKLLNKLLNKQCILNIVMYFLSVKKKEKILIARLRGELAFFGHDTTNMSNEEIKKVVKDFSKALGSFGATKEEAANTLRTLKKSKNKD